MSDQLIIADRIALRPQLAIVAAIPGAIDLQNVAGALKKVDDQAVATDIGGGLAAIANGAILANIAGSSAIPVGVQQEDLIDSGAAAVASVSLASAFGGIDSSRDGRYRIECYIVLPAGSNGAAYNFKPNGVSTAQFFTVLISNGVTLTPANVGDNSTPFILINAGTTNAGLIICTIEFEAKAGQPRHFRSHAFRHDPTAVTFESYDTHGYWNDSATNVTDMVISTTTGNNIGAHSRFKVQRTIGGQ